MNIARSLNKPAVPRSKRRRRWRRIKIFMRLFVLLVFLVSAALTCYLTISGIGMLWRSWGSPAYEMASDWLLGLSGAERFQWLNRIGWGASMIGILSALWVYHRQRSRCAYWMTVGCLTYTYVFLWYVLWLALRSYFEMTAWTENGLIGLAILGYVCMISRARLPQILPPQKGTREVEGV